MFVGATISASLGFAVVATAFCGGLCSEQTVCVGKILAFYVFVVEGEQVHGYSPAEPPAGRS